MEENGSSSLWLCSISKTICASQDSGDSQKRGTGQSQRKCSLGGERFHVKKNQDQVGKREENCRSELG